MDHKARPGREAVGTFRRAGFAGCAAVLIAAALLAACSGTASSPEGVVESFLQAIGEEDLLGAAERVLPSEHRFIVDPVLESIDESEQLGILSAVDLEQLQGIDFEFDGLMYETEELADDLVWVAVSGEFSSSVDRADLPLGSLVTHFLPAGWADEGTDEPGGLSPIAEDFGIAVVKEEGRWHVSLLFTIAEAARREAGEPFPTEQPLVEPAGAATPEEALERAALALFDLDLRGFVDVLSPAETAAFRRYSQLFIDEWDSGIAEFRSGMADAGFSYSVDEVVAGSEIGDEDKTAWIEDVPAFGVEFDAPDVGLITVDRDGDCLRIDLPPSVLESIMATESDFDFSQFDGEQCVDLDSPEGGAPTDPLEGREELLHEFPIIGPLIERWMESSSSLDEAGASAIQFEVEEVDGRWFVSLAGTMSRWVHAFASTLDEEILTEVGDQLKEAAEDPTAMDRLMEEWLTKVSEAGLLGPLGDPVGKPYIGPELLAPYAEKSNVLLVWDFDAPLVAAGIEASYGRGVVGEIIDGPHLFDIFVDAFGPGGTGILERDSFPVGIVIAPVDLDTLVEIFNRPEILDMFLASELGIGSQALVSVFDLAVGDCFDDPSFDGGEIFDVPVVPCASPHDNEVFFVLSMTEGTYPGFAETLDTYDQRCVEHFEGFVGIDYFESDLEVFAIVPTQESWDDGDRTVLCALYALDFSKLTGSMEGAAR